MSKLLYLKHWQLFLLLIGVPIVLQSIVISSTFNGGDLSTMMIAFPLMTIVFVGLFFGWFYALGTGLHRKLPSSVQMNLTQFKVFLAIPIIYILLLCLFTLSAIGDPGTFGKSTLKFAGILVPVHLFSMFCIFHSLYFIAKALKSTEWQRPVTFSDFAGEFFLIWFYPIGVWIIQPRINELFANDQNSDADLFHSAS